MKRLPFAPLFLVGILAFSSSTTAIAASGEEEPFPGQVIAQKSCWWCASWDYLKGHYYGLLNYADYYGDWSVRQMGEGIKISKHYGIEIIKLVDNYSDALIAITVAATDSVVSSTGYQKAVVVVSNPTVFLEAYGRLSRYASNLDWSKVDPTKYIYAGTRGVGRSMEAAMTVWESIPAQIRAQGPVAVAKYLADKDWSHIYPYSLGGSDAPSNGIFEDAGTNRARGSAVMTPDELKTAQIVLQSDAFHVTLAQAVNNALRGGVMSAAILGVVAVLQHGLDYQHGLITETELYSLIGTTIAAAGLTGAAVGGLVTAVALSFPVMIPVIATISVPLAVIGFAALGAQLVNVGKGWYEVYLEKMPLQLPAFHYWLYSYAVSAKDKVLGLIP